ncbi:hypothetical protein Q1695_015731 [Nippostrongylus brasiliensis]|nr:hypothetical protein Q1695_015731 [Nippostrongylus brasiliensis]
MSAINVFERALLLNVLLLLYHSVTHSEAERPHYYCDGEGEELIGDRCYQVRGYSAFADHEKACGNRYRIHKMEDLNTVRWISDRKAAAKGQLALKLRIMTCCNDGHEIGTTIFANTKRKNAFLCSRPAGITAKGIKKIADKMREVGFQVERARDKLSDPRLFTVLHSVTPFKRSLKQLNQACRFPEANFHHESQEYCPKPNGNEEMGDSNCKQNVKEEVPVFIY